MSSAPELDLLQCPLHGIQLIEASAGTGKTYNICGLYLRLLLERNFSVQQILVVTFTNAATAELRERIRHRIVDAQAFLQGEQRLANDPLIGPLIASLLASGKSAADLLGATQLALASFDEAAIFTIHGFCQRALADTPFTAHMPLSLELLQDDSDLVREVVFDFWRQHLAGAALSPALAAFLAQSKDTPDKWVKLLRRAVGKPLSTLRWPAQLDDDPDWQVPDISFVFQAAKRVWTLQRAEVLALLEGGLSQLKGNIYKPASLVLAAKEMDALLRGDQALALMERSRDKAALLGAAKLAGATKSKCTTPSHGFFDVAQALFDGLQDITDGLRRVRLRLLRTLVTEGAETLRARKRERRVVAFDDMLFNLYQRLCGSGDQAASPWLRDALRTRYPAALVDEFQDTDPLQFAVFKTIYAGHDTPLFMVGDPKQAIYSFRNADLHTYLAARAQAAAEYTLGANQRSVGTLIHGLNALFQANPKVFMLDGLNYHPVRVGAKPRPVLQDESVSPTGSALAPLTIWALPEVADVADVAEVAEAAKVADSSGPVLLKKDLQQAAARATAGEIARLLEAAQRGEIRIQQRALQAGDIAVLVRTHAEGSWVREALTQLRIGCVELSQASVFQSADARALECLLIAVLDPAREARVLTALATDLMALDANTLDQLHADPDALLDWVQRFSDWRQIWLQQGVGVMLRQWLSRENVAQRLLSRPDGERRLTNLLHLAECLHQAAQEHSAPDRLLHWFQTRLRDERADETSQLRLESDQNLVQIVTIHRAKGLEYPIVFCPFLWNSRPSTVNDGVDGIEYHDPDLGAVQDFREDYPDEFDDKTIKALRQQDTAAEFLRLVYVALTRAVHRCYVVAGCYPMRNRGKLSSTESQRSLLNWMVAGAQTEPADWLKAPLKPSQIMAAWHHLASQSEGTIALHDLPLAPPRSPLLSAANEIAFTALPAPLTPPQGWWTGSYSALAHGALHEEAALDRDWRVDGASSDVLETSASAPRSTQWGAAPLGEEPLADDDILGFPRGPVAGECLHTVFEQANFTQPDTWPVAIDAALAQLRSMQGTETATADVHDARKRMLQRMLHDVLQTPLLQGAGLPVKPLHLGDIAHHQRRAELEFLLPSAGLDARRLQATLADLGYPAPALDFGQLRGYLKGFIDLVFVHDDRYFVLDWKSNFLGTRPADYARPALEQAMQSHVYHLQYLLYSVALDRYLRKRLPHYQPELHWGGVLYVFVRGVRPDWTDRNGHPTGVYVDRPSPQVIARLSALFDAAQGIQ